MILATCAAYAASAATVGTAVGTGTAGVLGVIGTVWALRREHAQVVPSGVLLGVGRPQVSVWRLPDLMVPAEPVALRWFELDEFTRRHAPEAVAR
jgi:hypothetical protein